MKKYKKCSIFFDANTFERRHSGKELFLDAIEAGDLFYDIRNVVNELGLTDYVKLCIPEIVWREVKKHLTDKFKSTMDSLNCKIEESKKSLGDLVDIQYELKGINSIEEYPTYVDTIALEFLNNPKNNTVIIPCPVSLETLDFIINKAIEGVPPFKKVKTNGKEYNDAGVKDVLIWETIRQYGEEELLIFVTKDTDFDQVDKENINICTCCSDVEKILIEHMDVSPDKWFSGMLLSNEATLLGQIMLESGFENFKFFKVESVSKCEFGKEDINNKTLTVVCDINIDGTLYQFTIRYDVNANELVEVNYDEYLKRGN